MQISTTASSRTGFQVTARLANNQTAGKLEPQTSQTEVRTQGGFEFVSQATASHSGTYRFRWSPPGANLGDVKFFVAAVGGQSDGVADASDEVYTAVYTLRHVAPPIPSGYRWVFIDVGGSTGSANGISNDSRVVGTYAEGSRTRGFLRQPDGTIEPLDYPDAVNTTPLGINSSGVIVGSFEKADGRVLGFMRTAAGVYSAFDIPGAMSSLTAVTDSGEMLGTVATGAVTLGVRVSPALQITSMLPEVAHGLNNAGDLVGPGFLRDRQGNPADLVNPCGVGSNRAWGRTSINDVGDLVGTCSTTGSSGGGMTVFLRSADSRTVAIRRLGSEGRYGPESATGVNIRREITSSGRPTPQAGMKPLLLVPCSTALASNTLNVPAAGGPVSVQLTAEAGCHWLYHGQESWVSPGPMGEGTGTLILNIDANAASPRSAVVWVGGNPLTIVQDGVACIYTLSATSILLGSQGGNGTLGITAPPGCSWTAIASGPWVTLQGQSGGSGNGTIAFAAFPNPGPTLRTATISVAGQTFFVNQLAAPVCSFQVSVDRLAFSFQGGSGTATVVTGDSCGWTANSTASWVVVNGNTQRTGSGSVTFTIAANPGIVARSGTLAIAGQSLSISQSGLSTASSAAQRFVPMTPCRVMETRPEYNFQGRTGAFGPPFLARDEIRTLSLPQSNVCQIPTAARTFVLNVTVVPRGAGVDHVTVWPAGEPRPLFWSVRSPDGQIVANSAIIRAGLNNAISISASDVTDILIDISGYFTDDQQIAGLSYFPVPPCRVIDTRPEYRAPAGPFGPPILSRGESRKIPFAQNPFCPLPPEATAYSVTFTVVPPGPLAFVTIWPSDQPQPNVSTINSPAGRVLANNVIVPAAAGGGIDIFAFDATHVIVDINGYFARESATPGLSYYPADQCRLVDTRYFLGLFGSLALGGAYRGSFGGPMFAEEAVRTVPIASAPVCQGLTTAAKAWVLNATVLPNGSPMPFLTLWPTGQPRPNASMLNAFQGQVITNQSIVPVGPNGAVDIFAFRPTHLILEVSGMFR